MNKKTRVTFEDIKPSISICGESNVGDARIRQSRPTQSPVRRRKFDCTLNEVFGLLKLPLSFDLAEDLDTDYEPIGAHGACGVLFRVKLKSHGYTVVAKATPIDFVYRLEWEATIYKHLRLIQGIRAPVHFGNIDLDTPYFYEGIAELVHMMFVSFGGKRISTENAQYTAQPIDCLSTAIHTLASHIMTLCLATCCGMRKLVKRWRLILSGRRLLRSELCWVLLSKWLEVHRQLER
ncbi:uncharacterized protein BDZ99DRAFT_287494 [Mytilinidion resinicola]|uniref:Protein kinase domain-containing protein n=1 Tax=Mytilinidion resinicola TaxID=574789 RepID=A0A6A6YPN2_9PEZI|nr:uncharacterized protein BDZ99DRAFT_287494 [Mytilinidion resinicola]KAF2810711.1 hypothetical protein BDZ99DRAFT_287494 [Mytilinidion resinicola]